MAKKIKDKESFPGYPEGNKEDDIYNQGKKVEGQLEEEEELEMDLDVPGADLDNFEEFIGSEDEENNYYSLDDQDEDGED
jgi:hypothetical protein